MTSQPRQEHTPPPNNPALIQKSRYLSVHFNSAQTDVTELLAWEGNWTGEQAQTRRLPLGGIHSI